MGLKAQEDNTEKNNNIKTLIEKDETNTKEIKRLKKMIKKFEFKNEELKKKNDRNELEMQEKLEKIVTSKSTEISRLRDDLLKKENDNKEALATVNLLMTNLKKQLEASKNTEVK